MTVIVEDGQAGRRVCPMCSERVPAEPVPLLLWPWLAWTCSEKCAARFRTAYSIGLRGVGSCCRCGFPHGHFECVEPRARPKRLDAPRA